MRNTGDLRLVSGLNCGGIYCFLLLSEWKEVTPSLLNSQIIHWFATVNIYSDRSCKLTKTRGELIRIDPYFRLHPSGWGDVFPRLTIAYDTPTRGGPPCRYIHRDRIPAVLRLLEQIVRYHPLFSLVIPPQFSTGHEENTPVYPAAPAPYVWTKQSKIWWRCWSMLRNQASAVFW